jgi:hypothetical protein
MKFLVVIWTIIIALLGVFGTIHADDTDKNGTYKVNWRMLLMFIMFPLTPVVAHFCGLI